jgi:hypothetical protein
LPKQQPSDATVVSEEQDLTTPSSTTVIPAERIQQIMVGVDGHETTDTGSEPGSGDSPNPAIEIHEDSTANKESPQPQQQSQQDHVRILIDWSELSDKMAELHYKDIKNFWLCGRIVNGKLLDIVLEREQQPQQVMA